MRKAQMFVPPGGFLGWGSQTAAVQALLRPGKRVVRRSAAKSGATGRKRKATTARKRPIRRRRTRTTTNIKKPARMVKGSAAAKRHMSKLRRMRKK